MSYGTQSYFSCRILSLGSSTHCRLLHPITSSLLAQLVDLNATRLLEYNNIMPPSSCSLDLQAPWRPQSSSEFPCPFSSASRFAERFRNPLDSRKTNMGLSRHFGEITSLSSACSSVACSWSVNGGEDNAVAKVHHPVITSYEPLKDCSLD